MFTLYVSCENLHHSLPKELFYNFQLQICLIFHPTLKSFVQRAWWTIQRKKICEMICELYILPAREWIAMYMYSSAFSWMLCPDRIYFSSFSTGREWIFLLIYSFTFSWTLDPLSDRIYFAWFPIGAPNLVRWRQQDYNPVPTSRLTITFSPGQSRTLCVKVFGYSNDMINGFHVSITFWLLVFLTFGNYSQIIPHFFLRTPLTRLMHLPCFGTLSKLFLEALERDGETYWHSIDFWFIFSTRRRVSMEP